MRSEECTRAPEGWWCSRAPGHDGPCAARAAYRDVWVYSIPDPPKSVRETLCIAQARIGASELDVHRKQADIALLQRIIDECDRHRPLGPDGKHDDRHTGTCGCEEESGS